MDQKHLDCPSIYHRDVKVMDLSSHKIGMSFISMIGMEAAMNITDVILTGGALLTWYQASSVASMTMMVVLSYLWITLMPIEPSHSQA